MVEDGQLTLATIDREANVGQLGNDILEDSQVFHGFIPKRCVGEIPYIEL